MKNKIIKMLGGFPDVESAVNHIKEIDDQEHKREILSESVSHLYNAISEADIFKQKDGKWVYKGKPVQKAEYDVIKQEAQMFVKTRLYDVLFEELKYHLGKKMFEEAKHPDDILWGQLLTYIQDVMETTLKKFK